MIQVLVEKLGESLTVERLWLAYADMILRPIGVQPSDVQWQESKKVFYAAYHGALEVQFHVVGHPELDDEKGAALLQRMMEECEAFAVRTKLEVLKVRKGGERSATH